MIFIALFRGSVKGKSSVQRTANRGQRTGDREQGTGKVLYFFWRLEMYEVKSFNTSLPRDKISWNSASVQKPRSLLWDSCVSTSAVEPSAIFRN